MIPKSACPLWPADNRSYLGRKARHSAASYTTYMDTIALIGEVNGTTIGGGRHSAAAG